MILFRHFLLFVVVVTSAHAQSSPSFVGVVGGPGVDRGIDVKPASDGGYVVVGLTKSFGAGEEDVYLVKASPQGEIVWSRTFGGDARDYGWSIQILADGILVAGSTESLGHGGFDCYLIKTDGEGERVWSTTFGGLNDDRCWASLVAPDEGYLLVGETVNPGGEEDCYLVKTDAFGNMLWVKSYGGTRGDRCFALAPAPDGGYLLVGQTYSEGAGDRDAYVVKVDSRGAEEWTRTFGGTLSDVAHGIVTLSDGNFLVTGYTTSFASKPDDPYLIKLSASGDTLWTRVLSLEGHNRTISADERTDGGFCLTGFSTFDSTGVGHAVIIQTDELGRLVEVDRIFPDSKLVSFGYTVRASVQNACVVTGHTSGIGEGDLQLFVASTP
jgi:hypothetical protein